MKVRRHRRGLMNFLGKTSKWLFGTMDEEDRQELTKHLQALEENSFKISQGLNQQIRINDYFNETLHLFIENNRANQNQLAREYNNLTQELRELIKHQRVLDATLKLQILEDKVDHILDNIASVKAGALHPGILTIEEINTFNISVEKLENARLGILSYDSNTLVINIKIPVKIVKVPLLYLVPIPNNLSHEISEESQLFIEFNNKQYVAKKKVMYKNELEIIKTCLSEKCNKRINMNEEIIEINKEVILGINLKNPKIVNNCDERKLELKGNYLFNIQNCSIIINNVKYANIVREFQENNIFEVYKDNWKNANLTLEKLAVKHVENLKHIKLNRIYGRVSLGISTTIIIIIIVILSIITYLYRKRNYLKIQRGIGENGSGQLPQERQSNLKEGGVTLSNSTDHIPRELPNFSIPTAI